ncbi:hypothetical protein Q73A0000_13905 [Kaistella flava (ex Peng et al. 2021)]|uniref:Uncharacterized protein n=1 Tax=Kaistella flava (ex Peng et al. 2021) TaxID=2038776 RepID=A0A7M2YAS5_9FLAO|nr:hypothetical protein [Kaistella flava (ex Peng et al. 2021)]QOW11377.1 hypothetical protein Q73A0000_13905 [Kaistella flava (ex Peng et al. 2021)]
MKKIIFLVLFMLFSKSYSQTNYFPMPSNGDEIFHIVSKNVLVKRISEKRAWVKYVDDDKRVKSKSGKIISVKGGYLMSKSEFKCTPISERMHKTFTIIEYDGKNEPLGSKEYSYPDWETVPPETNIDSIARFVCDGEINL